MKTVGAYEAKTHFSRLLDEVASGESVTVTRNGRAVARIVPVESREQLVDRLIVEGRRLRARVKKPFTVDEIREMVEEGRK